MDRRPDQPSSRSNRWPAIPVAAAVLVLAAASSCSSVDDDTTAAAGTTTTSPAETVMTEESPPTTYASVEDEIVARYKGFWDARFAANSPPNPDDPALREYATGEQLDQVQQETRANLAAGVELRRATDPAGVQQVEVVSLDDNSAVVQECYVDDGLVVRTSDGSVVDDSVSTHNVRGEMLLVDGEWLLAKATLVQQWEGVAGCALAE